MFRVFFLGGGVDRGGWRGQRLSFEGLGLRAAWGSQGFAFRVVLRLLGFSVFFDF